MTLQLPTPVALCLHQGSLGGPISLHSDPQWLQRALLTAAKGGEGPTECMSSSYKESLLATVREQSLLTLKAAGNTPERYLGAGEVTGATVAPACYKSNPVNSESLLPSLRNLSLAATQLQEW